MNTITHALAPVILAHLFFTKSAESEKKKLFAIGFAGALPDVLSPHITLEARLTSWSHGLPFWFILSLLLCIATLLSKKRSGLKLTFILSAAYLFHLICDACSGGINWLYPFKQWIWGDYWINPIFWIPLDLALMAICYYLFRIKKIRRPPKIVM